MMSHIRDFSRFLRISSTAAALATHPPAHDGPSRPSNAPPRGPRSPPVAWRAWGLVPHIPRPQSRPPRPTLPPLPSLHDAVRQQPGGEVVVGRRASPQRPQRVRVASLSTGAPGSRCLCKQKARGGQRGSGRDRNLNARARARAKYEARGSGGWRARMRGFCGGVFARGWVAWVCGAGAPSKMENWLDLDQKVGSPLPPWGSCEGIREEAESHLRGGKGGPGCEI